MLEEQASSDEAVRLEVYRTLEALATPDWLSALAGYLPDTESEEGCAAAQNALVAMLSRIEVEEDRVEAVGTIWAEASETQRLALIEVLPRIGGEEALRLAREAAGSSDPALKETATRALAEWPEPEAVPVLLDVAEHAETS